MDNDDNVVRIDVHLTQREYEVMLMMTGYVSGMADTNEMKWKFIHLVNRLFANQPGFVQYEIPYEYRWESIQ